MGCRGRRKNASAYASREPIGPYSQEHNINRSRNRTEVHTSFAVYGNSIHPP